MAISDNRFRASLAALEAAKSVNPDRYAQARQQGRLLNLPAKALYAEKDEDNAPQADENQPLYRLLKLAQEGNGYAKDRLAQYGRTLQALANPELAAVSQDDQHSVARMEDALRQADFNRLSLGEKLANAWKEGWWQLRQGADVQLLKNQAQNGGLLDQYLAMDREFAQAKASGKRWDNPNKYLYGFEYFRANEEQRAQMREVAAKGDKTAWDSTTQRLVQRQADMDALPVDPTYIRMERLKAAGLGDGSSVWQAVTEQPAFIPRLTAGAAPASLEILGAAAVGGMAAGPVGSLGAMAATEYPIEYQTRFVEVLQQHGVDMGNPAELLKALQDDALMQAAEREAHLKATGTTAVDVGLGVIAGRLIAPLKVFGRTLSRGQREAANLIAQMPIQGLGEGASEAAGEYLASGQVKWDNALLEALAGFGFTALDVGVFSQQRLAGYLKTQGRPSRRRVP